MAAHPATVTENEDPITSPKFEPPKPPRCIAGNGRPNIAPSLDSIRPKRGLTNVPSG